MKLEQLQWKQNQPLAEDYISAYARVGEMFEYNPWVAHSFRERAEWLDRDEEIHVSRDALAQALEQFNRKIGNCSSTVMESIRRLQNDGALVVVGGQQAGLFTGPMLAVYKAISIIRAAKQAELRLQRPVIPVFWIAGEDHDLEEVNHIHYLTPQLSVEKLELVRSDDHGQRIPISRLTISAEQWEQVLGQLDASLMPTEFKPHWMGKLREVCAHSNTLVDLFAGIMSILFGSEGLVLMDSDDCDLRKLEAPFFREIIVRQQRIEESLHSGKERVVRLGYEPQADVRQGSVNLFLLREDKRISLQRQDGYYTDKTGQFRMSETELLECAARMPEQFSNNVFTRPLMQSYLFPVLSTVLGPGEIAYWALIRDAFVSMGRQMPIIMPRLEFTLVEGTIQKQLNKLGLTVEDAVLRLEEKRDEWLAARDSLGLQQLFMDVKVQFEALYAPVMETVATINPGMRQLGETNRQKILEQITYLEDRSKDAFESQFDTAKRQYERIRQSLIPAGKKQERVFNVLAYLNKYGDDWLQHLLQAELDWNGNHYALYL